MLAIAAILGWPKADSAQAAAECTKVASTTGSDSASGTASDPFATARRLVESLAPGETGCLRAGRYQEHLKVSRGGRDGSPITLMSYPGEQAELAGRLWVARGADSVRFTGLRLNGANPNRLPSPTVNASDVRFDGNDITNDHSAICFVLGTPAYGRAERTVIESNRIHDCGRLPANNHEHGIYIEYALDTVVRGNFIFDNADRGIQLFPDAQRTQITQNVIDGNGQGIVFSGEGTVAANDTVVERNVITNSVLRDNVESWYPQGTPIGERNVVRENCISGGAKDDGDGGIQRERIGFSTENNILARPRFADRGAGDLSVEGPSACASLHPVLDRRR